MTRPSLALVLTAIFFGVNFGLRTWQHWRATGTTGYRGFSGRPGSAAWFGGALFVVAVGLLLASPVLEVLKHSAGASNARHGWLDLVAVATTLLGIAGTTWAQSAMGVSWRIGVRETERTEMVDRGPFRWMRNPIFSFMLVAASGLVALLPNAVSTAGFVALVVAVELQVRVVEEPYLLRAHGERYAAYCKRVGRFVPLVGRGVGSPAASTSHPIS